jgi:ribosomal subunit interface protein
MKLTFTGIQKDFSERQQLKLGVRLKKLAKTIEHHGEREGRAVVTQERHLNRVEVTLNAFDHSLVGRGADRDLFTATNEALDKLEKQVLKMGAKWRTTKRHRNAPQRTPENAEATGTASLTRAAKPKIAAKAPAANGQAPLAAKKAGRIFRVNERGGHKPMTAEEALLEIDPSDSYFAYRDAHTDRVAVLLRRSDGNFDLLES